MALTVLSVGAEFERELIQARINEGRARAVGEGRRFGRKPKLTKHQTRGAEARGRWQAAARDRAEPQRRLFDDLAAQGGARGRV